MTANLESALAATTETDAFDFKISFDASAPGAWCELVKDLVAIGNSGGGAILIGVDRAGHTVGAPAGSQKTLDPAAIGDQVRKYTGGSDPRCSVHYLDRHGGYVLVILIASVRTPVAFEQAGTYMGLRKNECAFQAGTFYFRRNTKSAPGTTEDVAEVIEREIARRREEWLGNIRQVMEAPAGSKIAFSAIAPEASLECRPIRLSNEPDAERIYYRSRDETHPHRMKELIAAVQRRLPPGVVFKQGDLQAVRRAYDVIDNPNWADTAKHASTQYSRAFEDWLVDNFSKDSRFSAKARAKARREGK